MDTNLIMQHDAVVALREKHIRVIKVTLRVDSETTFGRFFTRKTKQLFRKHDILIHTEYALLDVISKWADFHLEKFQSSSQWMLRLYPDTGRITAAPIRNNGHPKTIWPIGQFSASNRRSLSEKITRDDHSARSLKFHMMVRGV